LVIKKIGEAFCVFMLRQIICQSKLMDLRKSSKTFGIFSRVSLSLALKKVLFVFVILRFYFRKQFFAGMFCCKKEYGCSSILCYLMKNSGYKNRSETITFSFLSNSMVPATKTINKGFRK